MICHDGENVTLQSGYPTLNTMGITLGRIVRFCGHTNLFYPVLGHNVVVAALLPPEEGIYGLMHDSQESIFADVPSPMKTRIARRREHVVLERIYNGYGIPLPSEDTLERVEEADHVAVIAEAHVLGHIGADSQWGDEYDYLAGVLTKKYQKKAKVWAFEPEKASRFFIKEFNKYYALAGLDKPGSWR